MTRQIARSAPSSPACSARQNSADTERQIRVGLIYGLVVLDAVAALSGVLITQGGKVWYLDRMVLIFEAMKRRNPEFAAWEY